MPTLGALFLLLGCFVHLNAIDFALSYYILFCYAWLFSLRSLFFFNETEREWEMERKREQREGKL